jgi:hypothetical protein
VCGRREKVWSVHDVPLNKKTNGVKTRRYAVTSYAAIFFVDRPVGLRKIDLVHRHHGARFDFFQKSIKYF